ncbi:SGNH/GDSL hydrolase family protein [Aeromicrobium alkaliterrae]|uniref:SGNH hydrolase-type esterase domain-containing protein n=1 Tax=Aeromicrobium alkaliterrae TaxID=302168 RepID=A0ABP4W803_9ACTN
MTTPVPLRVLVKGASTVNFTSWMGGPRTDFTFPRVIEEQLLAAGVACEVRQVTMAAERAKTLLPSWQREVLDFSPDVIVLVYGHAETIHLFAPRVLERHVNSLKARPGRVRQAYRRLFLRPAWKLLVRLQAAVDARLGHRFRRRMPRKVAAEVEAYVRQVQTAASPLVFCFEILPPASKAADWFPGMTARVHAVNDAMRAMVARVDRETVRYFDVTPVVTAAVGSDAVAATPDGFHYSPAIHRAVGESLATEILVWAETQPHLGPARD